MNQRIAGPEQYSVKRRKAEGGRRKATGAMSYELSAMSEAAYVDA